jgi:hypothetical protein
VLEQEEIRRRIRAAMALADISSFERLAEVTKLSRSTLKDLGTRRGRADEKHLRVIAAHCDLPYSWFTVADVGQAVSRDDEDPAVGERLEALEQIVAALVRRDGAATPRPARPDAGAPPPAPAGELGRRLRARGTTSGDPARPGSPPEAGSEPDSGG